MKLTLRTRLIFFWLLFAIVPVAAVTIFALDAFDHQARQSELRGLEGLVKSRISAIEEFTESRRLAVERLAGVVSEPLAALEKAEKEASRPPDGGQDLPALEDVKNPDEQGASPPEPPPAPEEAPPEPVEEEDRLVEALRRDLGRTLAHLLGSQRTFEELMIIALDGRVVESTFGEHENKSAAELEYFKRGRAATFVQPVFVSPITGELTMVIATPIRSKDNHELGVLAARLNLRNFFQMINDTAGLGDSGETLVGKKAGEEVVFMAPTRHDSEAALMRKVPLSRRELPLVRAAQMESGSGPGVDYRGKSVVAAWGYAPALEWGVVAKVDADEVAAPVTRARDRIVMFTILLLAAAVLAALLFARSIVKPLRELKDATDKISRGDFDVAIEINSKDEVGELADSFERMIAAIKFFREQSTGRMESLEDELSQRAPTEDRTPTEEDEGA